ncbi:MAG: cellulase family glycosylhydrolase [Oscillospiraceae bacterium]|nr:cellulase family glycosylhydrolase [Oscillospiraceae bacterium]
MLKELGFQKGVNLGGWLSQCDYSEDCLNNFITEADFKQIADLGFDHVRIPIDYNVIQNPDGTMRPDGLGRIDAALALCDKYGLKAVLDLHKTPGYSFDAGEKEAGFFESESYQERFYWIWETLAEWFAGMSDRVAFELLNEVTEARFLPAWKRISRECVRRIRFFAPDTIILLGSYNWNSARTVPELDAPYDDKMVYNFHFYEPHIFTHQGAYWMPELQNTRMAYAECGASEQWFEDFLAPAVEKAGKENCELYCGEFGVIDVVPPEEAIKWFRDLHKVFERHGIAHAIWSWKQMDFGLIDARMDGVRDELLKLL